jgi:hypothetical protein
MAFHAQLAASQDDDLLEEPHVTMKVAPSAFEVQDGVRNELAGTVPRGLPAAIDLENRMRQHLRAAKAGLISGAANRVNGLMFQEEELFAFGT